MKSKSSGGRSWPRTWIPSANSLRAARRWAVRGAVLVLLVLAIAGSIVVRDRVHADPRFSLGAWKLEMTALPEWVTPEIRAELESLEVLPPGRELTLLEPGVLRAVQSALESSPWIQSVPRMGIAYPTFEAPGVLRLDVRLRRPVAVVEQGGLHYLADAEGRRLGHPYREAPLAWFNVPALTGLASPGPLPAPGEKWTSRDVHQGIEVARILEENRILSDYPAQPIVAIDLSNLHGRVSPRESEIVLLSREQKLAWGRSPISAGARTVTPDEIVSNLRHVLAHPETYSRYALIHLHRKPETLTGVRG